MGLGLITAVYGKYDLLRPLPDGHGFDEAIAVTDDPELSATGWTILLEPREEHPRLAAKRPKFLPMNYLSTDSSVWIDAAFSINDGRFSNFARRAIEANDLTVWRHPEARDCLYQEASYCQDWPKYANDPIRSQVASYRDAGMPEHFGLFAAGTIGRRHTESVKKFGEAWLGENERWSIQDQISLPFLLWLEGITPGIWDAHEFQNDLLRYHPHLRTE